MDLSGTGTRSVFKLKRRRTPAGLSMRFNWHMDVLLVGHHVGTRAASMHEKRRSTSFGWFIFFYFFIFFFFRNIIIIIIILTIILTIE